MSRDKTSSLEWGRGRRPIVKKTVGAPNPSEGSDGDIQIRNTSIGAKMFGRLGGRWYDTPLSIDGTMRIGTNLSNHLSIDSDSVDIITNGTKVATFGATTTVKDINLTGQINITSTGTQNVCIGIGNSDAGTDNVAIGQDAGASFTNYQYQNIAIGTDALTDAGDAGGNLEGSFNIGVGFRALEDVSSGNTNVGVGGSAGEGITTGSGNTYIGGGTDPKIGIGGTHGNETVLGYLANGQGANTVVIGDDNVTNIYMAEDSGAKVWCTNIDSSSDERIKKNIKNITLGLNFINKLNPVTFNMRKIEEWDKDLNDKQPWVLGAEKWAKKGKTSRDIDDKKLRVGFIAQEVKEALGDTICDIHDDGDKNNYIQGLDYTRFVVPLVKAVQELSAEVETLKQQINS